MFKVGDTAYVIHGAHAGFAGSDLVCGDTTIREIKKNGTIVLKNGFKFHRDGKGHASNDLCSLRNTPIYPWNVAGLTRREIDAMIAKAPRFTPKDHAAQGAASLARWVEFIK